MNEQTMERLAEQLAGRMREQFPDDAIGATIRLRKSAQPRSLLSEAAGRAELLLRTNELRRGGGLGR